MNTKSVISPALNRLKWLGLVILMAGALLLLSACAETGDMYYQPRYDPLEPGPLFSNGMSAQSPISHTLPYASGNQSPLDPALTGVDLTGQPVKGIPVTVDKNLVTLGQERFNIYCTPCHGAAGKGDGKVIPFGFSKPPDLTGDSAKALTAGEIFGIIMNGRNKMYSYGYRVKPNERWAVISYIRALQLKNGPVNPLDLSASDLEAIGKQP